MAEQDQINDQSIYAVVDKVIQDLLRLDQHGRLRVYRTVGTFFGFEDSYPKVAGNVDSRIPANVSREPQFSSSKETPKEFLLRKRPNTNIERVACLAYYLDHYRGIRQFKAIDINKLNTEAAQTKLSNPSHVIRDAVRSGYLVAAATKDMKQLSADGEKYVEALPDRNAAKEVKPQSSRRSRKRTSTNRAGGDRGESEAK